MSKFINHLYETWSAKKKTKTMLKNLCLAIGEKPTKRTKQVLLMIAMNNYYPKTPIFYEDDDGIDDNGKRILREFYGCPNVDCNAYVFKHNEYCSKCGQHLNWKE